MLPEPLTTRTRLSSVSAMKIFSALSTAILWGPFNMAAVAGPPSPHALVGLGHALPLPATVEIIPVEMLTSRIRFAPESATKKLPALSRATFAGNPNVAFVAGPPSPQPGGADWHTTPVMPATVAIVPG